MFEKWQELVGFLLHPRPARVSKHHDTHEKYLVSGRACSIRREEKARDPRYLNHQASTASHLQFRVARPEVLRRAWRSRVVPTPFGVPQGVPPIEASIC